MKKIKFIFLGSEIGAGKKGAGMGISALKDAAVKKKSNLFSSNEELTIPDFNHIINEPTPFSLAKRINYILELYNRLSDILSSELKNTESFPVIISGDHSTAGGTIAGIRKAFPEGKIGVIWIDAHADIHSPYTTPSGNLHGMPLAAAMDLDNRSSAIHEPDNDTITYWEKLKNCAGRTPMINPEDIVFIGLRATESQEDYLIDKHSIKNIRVDYLRKMGVKESYKEILAHLCHCDHLYISLDVDCLDPKISTGTGTPVDHGFETNEVSELLNELITDSRVCVLEITEINPLLEQNNKMAETALDILESALSKTL